MSDMVSSKSVNAYISWQYLVRCDDPRQLLLLCAPHEYLRSEVMVQVLGADEAASGSGPGTEESIGSSGPLHASVSSTDKRSHAQKDKHKSAVGNHHRKDRALRKMAGGP